MNCPAIKLLNYYRGGEMKWPIFFYGLGNISWSFMTASKTFCYLTSGQCVRKQVKLTKKNPLITKFFSSPPHGVPAVKS